MLMVNFVLLLSRLLLHSGLQVSWMFVGPVFFLNRCLYSLKERKIKRLKQEKSHQSTVLSCTRPENLNPEKAGLCCGLGSGMSV